MATQALTVPINITWRRLAYAADMIDTNFGDAVLPPKWRSSMAIYYYVVPKVQTTEAYPDSRIIYLRLTCSITGWNLDEEIEVLQREINIGDLPDDLQKSIFEAFQAGALSDYSPCTSAIAQIAVYPHSSDNVGPDDFPFIFDFEPKKRELYETASASEEYLSSTSEDIKVQKGTTTLDSTEKSNIKKVGGGVGLGFKIGPVPVGINASASGEWGTRTNTSEETVNMKTTDTSRQEREATSFTTSFNQMYQLFNGYHLGTNRAVFYMQARPHTVTEGNETPEDPMQVEFNLVNGERRLEGVQDMFLVVRMPASLKGLCVQANLDTGHTINIEECGKADRRLLVTRRIVQNCALFDETGDLVPAGAPATPATPASPGPLIVGDYVINPCLDQKVLASMAAPAPGASTPGFTGNVSTVFAAKSPDHKTRVNAANYMNLMQKVVHDKMLRGFSSGRYKPRPIEETQTFRLLLESVLADVRLDLDHLVKMGSINRNEQQIYQKAGAVTVGDLFKKDVERRLGEANMEQLRNLQNKLTKSVSETLSKARATK